MRGHFELCITGFQIPRPTHLFTLPIILSEFRSLANFKSQWKSKKKKKKFGWKLKVYLTWALCPIPRVSVRAGPTCVPSFVCWRWQINAVDSRETRLRILFACIKVLFTKGACVTIQTLAGKDVEILCIVIEAAVIAGLFNARSFIVTCADVDDWAMNCTCSAIRNAKFNLNLKE